MTVSSKNVIIALDAMGGDNAPDVVLRGAELALQHHKDLRFMIFGDESRFLHIIKSLPNLHQHSSVYHTKEYISGEDKPSIALRKGRNSSMRLAIDAVKDKKADAVISAGNTGALMAMSKLVLRPLPGIDRPAIAAIFPTKKDRCVLLDLGANIDCNSDNLVQFALMGDAFAKVLLGLKEPKIGLLNVGSEDNKGSEIVKTAAEELKEGGYSINFYGYIEGSDIAEGVVDVVVTDGFTGNIALKTAEGTAKICGEYMKQAFSRNPFAMLGGLLAKSALKQVFKKMDPRMHNGAMFLGLNGISVKSHGGTDATGFANAIKVAYELAKHDINKKIGEELSFYEEPASNRDFSEEEIEAAL